MPHEEICGISCSLMAILKNSAAAFSSFRFPHLIWGKYLRSFSNPITLAMTGVVTTWLLWLNILATLSWISLWTEAVSLPLRCTYHSLQADCCHVTLSKCASCASVKHRLLMNLATVNSYGSQSSSQRFAASSRREGGMPSSFLF